MQLLATRMTPKSYCLLVSCLLVSAGARAGRKGVDADWEQGVLEMWELKSHVLLLISCMRFCWSGFQAGREGVEAEWEKSEEFHEKWKLKARELLANMEWRKRKVTKRVSAALGVTRRWHPQRMGQEWCQRGWLLAGDTSSSDIVPGIQLLQPYPLWL